MKSSMKGIVQNFDDLADSRVIMENKPFPFAIWFIYILNGILIASILWSYFSEIDIVVKAEGIVRPMSSISTLTPKVTGNLIKIYFKNGDYVKQSDLIYVIDHDSLLVQKNGYKKDIENITYDRDMTQKFIQSITEKKNLFNFSTEIDYYRKYEKFVLDSIQISETANNFKNKIELLSQAINGYTTILKSINSDKNLFNSDTYYSRQYLDYTYNLKDLQMQLDAQKIALEKMNILYQSGSISIQELNDSKSKVLSTQNSIEKYINESMLNFETAQKNARSTLFDNQTELLKLTPENQITSDYSYSEINKLIELNDQLKTYNQQIDSLTDNIMNLDININNASIKSPVNGILNLDQEYAIGDLVSAGSSLGTIVPNGDEAFKIQLYISNKDISQVFVGDSVNFQFHALPYKEYGSLEGKITQVNADASFNPATGASYYLVEASVENRALISYKGKQESIKVGMTLDSQVITTRKRVLLYLLEKLNFWS